MFYKCTHSCVEEEQVFLSPPTVPLGVPSSDGHQMGLDKELIWAAIAASGKGQIDGNEGGPHHHASP